jgi:hypothetical protein
MCGENPPIILTLYISVLGDLLCQSVTSYLREYIYLICHTSILQYHENVKLSWPKEDNCNNKRE